MKREFVVSEKIVCTFCKGGKSKSFCPDCNGTGYLFKVVDLKEALEEIENERLNKKI